MRYFTLSEFERSGTANSLDIDNSLRVNDPDGTIAAHIVELVESLLDPLRDAWGSGIRVTSGFRCKALNDAVGGSPTSAHLSGWAGDLQPTNGRMREFKHFVIEWLTLTGLAFDQCIVERDKDSEWIHLGLRNRKGKQRNQISYLTFK